MEQLPKVAVILIPVFIVLSILFCCFSCVLPGAAKASKQQFEEEMENASVATVIAVDHRISLVPEMATPSSDERNRCSIQ